MATAESEFKLRNYQAELLAIAKEKNSILFLPTGSGKTFIATNLILAFSNDLVKSMKEGGKRTYFLANTVSLVYQQAAAVRRHTPFKVMTLVGDMKVDFWNRTMWQEIEEDNQIFVLTSQIYLNALNHGYLSITNANLLIFDECHRAVKEQNMALVMRSHYKIDSLELMPRILGLSATLLNSGMKSGSMEEQIDNLVTTFDAKIITSGQCHDVSKFSTKPREIENIVSSYVTPMPHVLEKEVQPFSKSTFVSASVGLLNSIRVMDQDALQFTGPDEYLMNDHNRSIISMLKNVLKEIPIHLQNYGIFVAAQCVDETEKHLTTKLTRIEKKNSVICLKHILTAMRFFRNFLLAQLRKITLQKLEHSYEKASSPKIQSLLEIMYKIRPDDKCIIFVERKLTAQTICKLLKHVANMKPDISLFPDFITGHNHNPYKPIKEIIHDAKSAEKTMTRFASGETNVLVATDVIEEGIDLPDCNIVIRLDEIKTFRSYVQSKGRARKKDSQFIMFIDKTPTKVSAELKKYRSMEVYLKQRFLEKDVFHEDDGADDDDDVGDVYEIPSTGASINYRNAIPTLYRYCNKLPRDYFTQMEPLFWKVPKDGQFQCKVKLPINAAIKDTILSPVCQNTRIAKRAVAFNVVVELYLLNALDDYLMPVTKPVEFDDEEWFPNWREEESSVHIKDEGTVDAKNLMKSINTKKRKQGTKQEVRLVPLKSSIYLDNSRPTAGQTCYIHVIHIKPMNEVPETRRRQVCYELLQSSNTFGIVTRKRWPKLCDYEIFTELGLALVQIDSNATKIRLTDVDINSISIFHRFVFMVVLHIVPSFLIYDVNDESDYYLVPLMSDLSIDWKTINKRTKTNKVGVPSEEKRNRPFSVDTYERTIVVPWYQTGTKKEGAPYHIVVDISQELTLESDFGNDKFRTYLEYYETKYNLTTNNPRQKLIEVRPVTKQINCIKPGGSKVSQERKFFAPEFCFKEYFPADLWYKAIALPTILHRIHYCLSAAEFRSNITKEADLCAHCTADEQDVFRSPLWDLPKQQAEEPDRKNKAKLEASKNKKPTTTDMTLADRLTTDDTHANVDYFGNAIFMNHQEIIEFYNPPKAPPMKLKFSKPPELLILKTGNTKNAPKLSEIMQAMLPRCCGDIVDLERLETFGDSFLKFAVSLSLFIKFPKLNEGQMTTFKGKLLGNRNLFYCGEKLEIGSLIKTVFFNPRENWIPPCFTVPSILTRSLDTFECAQILQTVEISETEKYEGILSSDTKSRLINSALELRNPDFKPPKDIKSYMQYIKQQTVSDKTVSDVVEALIGIYLQTGGIDGAFTLLKFLGVLAGVSESYTELLKIQIPSPLTTDDLAIVNHVMPMYSHIEEMLAYHFNDPGYLLQAFTHPSYTSSAYTDCYQRLEMLGDALLDFLITGYIYEHCGNLPPGKLTDLRSALVNNVTFGAFAVRLGLHKYLVAHSKKLLEAIDSFVRYQEKNGNKIYGNDMVIMVAEADCTAVEEVDVPKALGDIFESLAAAIYMDSGKDLETVWRIYYNIMKKELVEFAENIPKNPVRALHETKCGAKYGCPEFIQTDESSRTRIEVEVTRKDGVRQFVGYGRNVSAAKRAVSKLTLKKLGFRAFTI